MLKWTASVPPLVFQKQDYFPFPVSNLFIIHQPSQSSRCGANLFTLLSSWVKSAPLISALQSPSYIQSATIRLLIMGTWSITYNVDDEAWFAGEWSMLKSSLDVLRDEVFWTAIEFDSSVVLGSKGSVVLLDAVAASAPIQMQIDNCWKIRKWLVIIQTLLEHLISFQFGVDIKVSV